MAEMLNREYSLEYTPQSISGSMTIWNDTPVSPYQIGDTFSPISGVSLQVKGINISDEVVGTLFGRPVRQWRVEIQGDSSSYNSIVYTFDNQNGIITGSMQVKNSGDTPVFSLAVGGQFTIPNVGTLTVNHISGGSDENNEWSITYDGVSTTSQTSYSYTDEMDEETSNQTHTVTITTKGTGTIPSPDYAINDDYESYKIIRVTKETDQSTNEWSYTYEGKYPLTGAEGTSTTEEYEYTDELGNGDVIHRVSATKSGNGSSSVTPSWAINTKTVVGTHSNIQFTITQYSIVYDTVNNTWTESCQGENPAPDNIDTSTEEKVTLSQDIEYGADDKSSTIYKIVYEISGKNEQRPADITLPSKYNRSEDEKTNYKRSHISTVYNETTKEYTQTWEGQYPAASQTSGSSAVDRYTYSNALSDDTDINSPHIVKVTIEKGGKFPDEEEEEEQSPSSPNEEEEQSPSSPNTYDNDFGFEVGKKYDLDADHEPQERDEGTYICSNITKTEDDIAKTYTCTIELISRVSSDGTVADGKTVSINLSMTEEDGVIVYTYTKDVSGTGIPDELEHVAGEKSQNLKMKKATKKIDEITGEEIIEITEENLQHNETDLEFDIISSSKKDETDGEGKRTWTISYEGRATSSEEYKPVTKETFSIRKEQDDQKDITYYTYTKEVSGEKDDDENYLTYYNEIDGLSVGNDYTFKYGTGKITQISREEDNESWSWTIESSTTHENQTPSNTFTLIQDTREPNGVTARTVDGSFIMILRTHNYIRRRTYERYSQTDSINVTHEIGKSYNNGLITSYNVTKETILVNGVRTIRYRHEMEVED